MSTEPSHSASWRVTGFALSGVGAMLFAIKGVFIKLIYVYHVDAITVLALRNLLSLPVFIAVGIVEWRRRPIDKRPSRRDIALAGSVGILGYYLSSWLDFVGLQTLEAQTERLILFTYPFLVILFGRLLLGHPFRKHALAGAGLAYAGLIIMFGSDPARLTPAMLIGAAFVVGAAVTFALYQLFAREMINRCGPTLFTAIAMSAAGVMVLTHFALSHESGDLGMAPHAWVLIFGLALFSTIMPSFLMSAGTARIGAQGTAIISTLSPVVTIIVAVSILGEPFGIPEAIGTVFVIGGVALFTLIENRLAARARAA